MSEANARPRRVRLSFETRCQIVARATEQGMSVADTARCSGVHRSTVYRLLARYRLGGWAALKSRPSRPAHCPWGLDEHAEREILGMRALTGAGPQMIGAILDRPASTVHKVLARHGRSRLPRPVRDPVIRYERARPGELVHIDIKRLGRFFVPGKAIRGDGIRRSPRAGWQYLHVAIDDHSRIAYAEILPGQGEQHAARFVRRAAHWFADRGIRTERVLTDNGSCYRSRLWSETLQCLGITPKFTRPRRPQTNGKAESLIKTMLREWVYRYAYPSSAHRAKALSGWLRWYNRRRPHGSLGGRPPMSRVAQVRGYFI